MTDQEHTPESYDEYAEKWAKGIKSGKRVSHIHLEKPAMYAKLPNLENCSVLCLGCGSGEECDYLQKKGAGKVVGIDASKGLIEQARYNFPKVEFQVMDMRQLDFAPASFDFIYSSLAMHYVENWTEVLRTCHKILKPEGRMLFSTHHPVYWSGEKEEDGSEARQNLLGFVKDKKTDLYRIYGDYLNPRSIDDKWFGQLKVRYYHKPFSQMLREIQTSGFELVDCVEPKALAGAKPVNPSFYDIHQKIPLFVIFEIKCRRQ